MACGRRGVQEIKVHLLASDHGARKEFPLYPCQHTFPVEAAGDVDDDTGTASQALQVLQVGPLLPPSGFDGCITKGDPLHDSAAPRRRRSKNPSMWQADETCAEWLDEQRAGSVIYVSFGSWVA